MPLSMWPKRALCRRQVASLASAEALLGGPRQSAALWATSLRHPPGEQVQNRPLWSLDRSHTGQFPLRWEEGFSWEVADGIRGGAGREAEVKAPLPLRARNPRLLPYVRLSR